eukprot:8419396-Pyramimonas_sp.AAC.1
MGSRGRTKSVSTTSHWRHAKGIFRIMTILPGARKDIRRLAPIVGEKLCSIDNMCCGLVVHIGGPLLLCAQSRATECLSRGSSRPSDDPLPFPPVMMRWGYSAAWGNNQVAERRREGPVAPPGCAGSSTDQPDIASGAAPRGYTTTRVSMRGPADCAPLAAPRSREETAVYGGHHLGLRVLAGLADTS